MLPLNFKNRNSSLMTHCGTVAGAPMEVSIYRRGRRIAEHPQSCSYLSRLVVFGARVTLSADPSVTISQSQCGVFDSQGG
jgi:hypothetical protein